MYIRYKIVGYNMDIMQQLSKHVKSGRYRPARETPSKWPFAGWPMGPRLDAGWLAVFSRLCQEAFFKY